MGTKTDRELIEMAAKAAGLELQWESDGTIQNRMNRPTIPYSCHGVLSATDWDPRKNDGDRYRLAKHLKMLIHFECKLVSVNLHDGSDESLIWERWENNEDEAYAVLRLAARIGESK